MANWTNERNPFGPNRTPVLQGWASDNSGPVPVAVDKATGAVLTEASGAGGGSIANGTYNSTLPTLTSGQNTSLQLDSNGRLITTLGTGLSQAIDSILTYPRGSNSTLLTATGLVYNGAGKLTGIFCSSSTSLTAKLWDNTAASGTVLIDTFSLTAATFYPFPNLRVGTGIYATLGGTGSAVFCYDPTTT